MGSGVCWAWRKNFLSPRHVVPKRRQAVPARKRRRVMAELSVAIIEPHVPRFARHSSTAPTAWKMKFGSQTNRYGAHSARVSSDLPSIMKL